MTSPKLTTTKDAHDDLVLESRKKVWLYYSGDKILFKISVADLILVSGTASGHQRVLHALQGERLLGRLSNRSLPT